MSPSPFDDVGVFAMHMEADNDDSVCRIVLSDACFSDMMAASAPSRNDNDDDGDDDDDGVDDDDDDETRSCSRGRRSTHTSNSNPPEAVAAAERVAPAVGRL